MTVTRSVPAMGAPASVSTTSIVADRAAAERHIARVCFKTGPPRLTGVELEWIAHHVDDPRRRLDRIVLADALGEHAPSTLTPGSPQVPLPHGGVVTVEPGGQVEISTPPHASLTRLHVETDADVDYLIDRLASAGLSLSDAAHDSFRSPRRLLDTPRYAAMERTFDRVGAAGRAMMCGTAGLQICLDAGSAAQLGSRWQALHAIGPALLALFANSPGDGWVSQRMRIWYDTDPARTFAPPAPRRGDTVVGDTASVDTAEAWARRVLDTPLLCRRRTGREWEVPVYPITFGDWIDGALSEPPTFSDLDYHLTTVFPPVRPQGHLEVRYLDAQPARSDGSTGGWFAPVAMLVALTNSSETTERAADIAAPVAGAWRCAARDGLRDRRLAAVAAELVTLAVDNLDTTDLPTATTDMVRRSLDQQLTRQCSPDRRTSP